MTSEPSEITKKRHGIKVTEQDIAWGVKGNSSRCMVSRAIAQSIPDAMRIEVDTQTIRFTTPEGRFAFLTPFAVQQYVVAFDAGDPIKPFQFQLRNGMKLRQRIQTPDDAAENRKRLLTGAPRKQAQQTRKADAPNEYPAPPRVWHRASLRTYGHRRLRINQEAELDAALKRVP